MTKREIIKKELEDISRIYSEGILENEQKK